MMLRTQVLIISLYTSLVSVTNADDPIKVESVRIAGAIYKMGAPEIFPLKGEFHYDELPVEVEVRDFEIGKSPITAAQMCKFLNSPDARLVC